MNYQLIISLALGAPVSVDGQHSRRIPGTNQTLSLPSPELNLGYFLQL